VLVFFHFFQVGFGNHNCRSKWLFEFGFGLKFWFFVSKKGKFEKKFRKLEYFQFFGKLIVFSLKLLDFI